MEPAIRHRKLSDWVDYENECSVPLKKREAKLLHKKQQGAFKIAQQKEGLSEAIKRLKEGA